MKAVRDSRFWEPLLQRYARSPSIALCRIPEVEYFSQLPVEGPVLDHCCGDGYIASLAFPGTTFDAGIDLNERSVATARATGRFRVVCCADASRELPFEPATFTTVINNSAIEHIPDLDATVAQVARVLRPGGRFCFNVLNTRFFEWWPLGQRTRDDYRRFQPFFHALDEAQWTAVLTRHGFDQVHFRDYFPRATAEVFADYDYRYSAFYISRKPSLSVAGAVVAPQAWLRDRWRRTFGGLAWEAQPGQGAGFLVTANRAG